MLVFLFFPNRFCLIPVFNLLNLKALKLVLQMQSALIAMLCRGQMQTRLEKL